MKVFNSKLAAIGLAAFVFASCSDSSSDPATPITPGTVPSEITKIGLTVTHKRIGTSGNSANYVAVKNGLIYVAYGKGRIQVFKLTGGDAQQ